MRTFVGAVSSGVVSVSAKSRGPSWLTDATWTPSPSAKRGGLTAAAVAGASATTARAAHTAPLTRRPRREPVTTRNVGRGEAFRGSRLDGGLLLGAQSDPPADRLWLARVQPVGVGERPAAQLRAAAADECAEALALVVGEALGVAARGLLEHREVVIGADDVGQVARAPGQLLRALRRRRA